MKYSTDYLIVPLGMHLIELIKRNQVNVIAAIDYRNNGSLQKAGLDKLTNTVYAMGPEKQLPFLSIASNVQYYNKWAKILDQYPDSKVIISGNYTPITRFIIDYVGVKRVELWEDGMNHYIGLEQLSPLYYLKAIVKLLAGFYPKNIFDNRYKSNELTIKDRFIHKNIDYKRPFIKGSKCYYIGQPLIEDSLISERMLEKKLSKIFFKKQVYYLPHPREQKRQWLSDIFTVLAIEQSAEEYLIEQGVKELYSAFSTVNMNIDCETNVYLCKYLGLSKIATQLGKYDFNTEFI